MTNNEAVEILRNIDKVYRQFTEKEIEALEMAIEALSAEKTAEWHIVGKTTLHYECSKCGGAGDKWDNFCKHCGRRMLGEQTE